MTPRHASAALLVLAAVAGLEWVCAARAYRAQLGPEAWTRAAEALAELPQHEPVFLGTPWLGPSARQHLSALRPWSSIAPPDLHGLPRFHVLGLASASHSGAWSSELAADLGELPAPQLLGADDLGPLRLYHYEQPTAGTLLTDWLAAPNSLQLRDDRGPCRLSSGTWSCKQGRVTLDTLEIDYRPRRCLAIDLDDGRTLEISRPDTQLGAVLRGHLGFADFNARLRNDAPALLELLVDDLPVGRWTLTDSQGWAAFAAPTTPGTHDVRLRLTTLLGGTWTEHGYDSQPRRSACLELRALSEAPR
jgi:hypothetical protein